MPITIGTYPILDNLIANPIPNSYPSANVPSAPLGNNVITNQSIAPIAPTSPYASEQTVPYPERGIKTIFYFLFVQSCFTVFPFFISDPPSYEDALKSGPNFKPKYPVYRRATSYSSHDA